MGGAMGGRGGMASAMGGFGGDSSSPRANRTMIAETSVLLAIRDKSPKSRAILKKLEEPLAMSFADGTPLGDVLNYIKQVTSTPNSSGIPIYVDIKALSEAGVNLQSPVILDLDGVPLKTSLRLLLKQIGLAYCVRDGVLIVSSEEGVAEELEEAKLELEKKDTIENEGALGGGNQ
jgi:hypothetical protein